MFHGCGKKRKAPNLYREDTQVSKKQCMLKGSGGLVATKLASEEVEEESQALVFWVKNSRKKGGSSGLLRKNKGKGSDRQCVGALSNSHCGGDVEDGINVFEAEESGRPMPPTSL